MHNFHIKSYVDVNISFNLGIDIDPVLLVCINWSKVDVQNIVFATIAIIAWIVAVIARWVNFYKIFNKPIIHNEFGSGFDY